jgi:hypothetical protein
VDTLDVAAESEIEDEAAAAALGAAAIMHREPTDMTHAKAIVGWLRTGPRRLRDAYGADLADLFAEVPERWPRDVLRLLDEVGSDGLLPGKAADVRIALLLKDIEEAIAGGAVTAERPAALPSEEWGSGRDREVRDQLLDAIGRAAGSGPIVEALLRVAHRYDADIDRGALGAAGRELARYIADNPGLMRPDQWPSKAEVDRLLMDELCGRVRRGGAQPALVGDDWRHWLMGRGDTPAELAAAAIGAAVRHDDDREALVTRELSGAAGDPQRYAESAGTLFSQCKPTLREIDEVLVRAPKGTPPIRNVFDGLAQTVGGKGPVTAEEIRLCLYAVDRGLYPPSRTLEVTLGRATDLSAVMTRLQREHAGNAKHVKAVAAELSTVPVRLIRPYAGEVIDAVLGLPVFLSSDEVFGADRDLRAQYARRLTEVLRSQTRPTLAVAAFWLVRGHFSEDRHSSAPLRRALDEWLVRAPEKKIAAVGDILGEQLSKKWAEAWTEHVESASGRRRRYKIVHPFGGRS